jgi:hypothetical protein
MAIGTIFREITQPRRRGVTKGMQPTSCVTFERAGQQNDLTG